MTALSPVLILKTGRYAVHHGELGIIRSLGRMGVPVYTMAENHLGPAGVSRYLAGTFKAGNLPRSQMLEMLAKIGRKFNKPTILIPTDDLGAILIAEESTTLRQWFVFPDISAGLPRKLADKAMLYTLCQQIGLPCPNTRCPVSISDVNEFAESAKFPVIVKPIAGWLNSNLKVALVHSTRELVDVWHQAKGSQDPNLLFQEYIPDGEDWLFNGYFNGASDCLAGFTGMKLRSRPPHAGCTTLSRSVANDVLLSQAEALLKAISYAGIVDLDFRFDKRDRQYKLLDFNPRIGAQFRAFEDDNGVDVAKALYRDLTGEIVRRSRQVDGRFLVVEPDDLRASVNYFRRGGLSALAWLHSFRGRKEFAWFSWDDPLPAVMMWARLAMRGVGKMIRIGPFKTRAARPSSGVGQECKPDQEMAIRRSGLWYSLISIVGAPRR